MKSEKPTKYKNTHTLAVLLTLSTFLAAVFISGCASSPHALQENKGQTETAQQPNADTGQNKTENADTRHQESIEITPEAIDTCQITIPGISREYDLLFFTDTHIIIPETSKEIS